MLMWTTEENNIKKKSKTESEKSKNKRLCYHKMDIEYIIQNEAIFRYIGGIINDYIRAGDVKQVCPSQNKDTWSN